MRFHSSRQMHFSSSPRLLAFLVLAGSLAGPGRIMAQGEDSAGWSFLPGEVLFPPLLAHAQEPHVGIRLTFGAPQMKLDIGAGIDLVEFAPSPTDRFRMQALMFTYALTTSNEGLRLQVDAVDGFFGGALFYQSSAWPGELTVRLRILHRSAHFVDGHIDPSTGDWSGGIEPIPFTNDFGEILGAYSWTPSGVRATLYAGVTYSTLVRPTTIERLGTLSGIELKTPDQWWKLFGRPFVLYGSYDLSLTGIPRYIGTSILQAGMRFGGWSGSGIRLYVEYYNGLEAFGQYYARRHSSWGAGFAFDLW